MAEGRAASCAREEAEKFISEKVKSADGGLKLRVKFYIRGLSMG